MPPFTVGYIQSIMNVRDMFVLSKLEHQRPTECAAVCRQAARQDEVAMVEPRVDEQHHQLLPAADESYVPAKTTRLAKSGKAA